MDSELIRSWCLDFPETKLEYSENNEIYKVRNKTFAIIEQNRVTVMAHLNMLETKNNHE